MMMMNDRDHGGLWHKQSSIVCVRKEKEKEKESKKKEERKDLTWTVGLETNDIIRNVSPGIT